jgi:hypothetical protein
MLDTNEYKIRKIADKPQSSTNQLRKGKKENFLTSVATGRSGKVR